MNQVTDQISVERVAAFVTAVAPVALALQGFFQKLPVATQVAIVLVIGAAGVTWLLGRSRYTTVQQQLDATK